MSSEEKSRLLPKLKGAPLAVMIALCGQTRPLTAVELQAETGYTDKPISAALNKTLEPIGMVKKHGHRSGWTTTSSGESAMKKQFTAQEAEEANPPQQITKHNSSTDNEQNKRTISDGSASSTDGGKNPETALETGNNSVSPLRKNSEKESENYLVQDTDQICCESDLIEDKFKHQSDQINSDLIQPSRKNGASGSPERGLTVEREASNDRSQGELEALEIFMKLIGIENPAFKEILARDKLVNVVGWYWFTLGKEKIRSRPSYVIGCLKNGDEPEPAYRECARVWLAMREDDLDTFYEAKWRPYGARDYWQAQGLSQEAVEVFTRVEEHDGLNLFDDFERPILCE